MRASVRQVTSRGVGAVVVALLAILLAGCGIRIPADPHGTLDRVEGGVLRVGVTDNPPWIEVRDGAEPVGSEVELITAFAAEHDADIEWTEGSEAELLTALDRGELDVLLGGFIDDTPWIQEGAITRPYTEVEGPDGPERHVMIVRMGENAFLVALETFLTERAP